MSFENAGNLQNDLAAWKASGEYLKISGHQIFVKDEGDSQLPVLLLDSRLSNLKLGLVRRLG